VCLGERVSSRRVAAIDCGTNSIRLLIADVDGAAGVLVDRLRRMEVVRLGEGVDRTGKFSDAALSRTFAAVEDYALAIKEFGVEEARFCATSASRDAQNREEFIHGVEERLGIAPDIISGSEEASLSFLGATRELADENAPFLVVDIGGGSTEFVLGHREVEASISVDIGCVRMTERHMRSDPPTSHEVLAATGDIDNAIDLALAEVPAATARTVVAVAGTATTIAAAALGLTHYDPDRIHGSRISADEVSRVRKMFEEMTREQRSALGYMHLGRVDVIAAGAVVLDRILRRVGADSVVISEHDILDGIAFSIA
jgi:exopolyphosphatase / guanosine-5'-triphosphate,3'-diphosphate pyrophosphatase